MIRIALIEDHASLRQALAAVLAMTEGMSVVAEYGRVDPLGRPPSDWDVALVDLDLPGAGGVEIVRWLRSAVPPPACVVLTGLTDELEFGRALEAGAAAVLHKSSPIPELLKVIRAAAAGRTVVADGDRRRWLRLVAEERARRRVSEVLHDTLTPRERQVLEHLVWGASTGQIAAHLHISPETAQTHVRNLLGKLGVSSRVEAVSVALQHRLVDRP